MKKSYSVFAFLLILVTLAACGTKQPAPEPIRRETFLTLADVSGQTTLREDSPDVRVIAVREKAFIKQNDIRAAKQKAMESAAKQAVEAMVRELMPAEDYNRRYEEIERYLSKNIQDYIEEREVTAERKIFNGQFYGISAAFKVSRQKVLVALQKDLRLIDTSGATLVTVITSRKDLDLSAIGYRFQDIEDALMNQIQTDLNQRGLRAMDFRNAVVTLRSDDRLKDQIGEISKEQFMAMVTGDRAKDDILNRGIRNAEEFYSTGLTLLKAMAKVVVEVNILSVSKTGSSMTLNMNVTAKNISVGAGGAFANAIVQVARRAGAATDDSAMLTGLIKDAYEDMNKSFIPQVIKEMSTVDVGGDKLIRYELVMKGFDAREFRQVRQALDREQSDEFRYIDFDNSLAKAEPSLNRVFVRYAGRLSRLADHVMMILDENNITALEPSISQGTTDLVFEKDKSRDS